MPKTHQSKTAPGDILIVDDETANLKLLKELLSRVGYQVRPADRPQLAIKSALAQPPALILLDVRMPEMDGFEVCRRLKQDERTRDIPIIFISALQDVKDRIRGFEAGGVDFISKPFQEVEVLARVRTHMALHQIKVHLEELVVKRTADLTAANKALENEIYERKKAEKRLAKSEAKYRGLIDNSIVGVFASTIEGRFTFVNDAMARMFDFDSPEAMIAQRSFERWRDPRDRERMLAELQKHGSVTNFEAETITHADRKIDVLFSARQIGNDILGMVMDITRRKRIEKELQESHDLLAHLLSSIPDAVFSVRLPERVIEWAEDSYNTMGLGENPKNVQGLSTLKYFANPEDYDNFGEIQRQAIREGKRYMRTEVMLRREDGTPFPAEVTGTFYKVKGKLTRITALARDITDRKQAEQKLLDYQQRLKALASQLTIVEEKERRRIAADLHDQVGQSLALARLQIASVRKRASDPKQIDTLDEISCSLRHTVQQTRDLIYELSPPQLNEIGLSAAITEWLEEHVQKRYGIKTECMVNSPEEHLDHNLRSILFRNTRELVTNVIKHAQATQVTVRVRQLKDQMQLIVRDDGIGFDVDAVSQSLNSGGGFGLFSIRERMADMGGDLKIVSEPGQGTEAVLNVPIMPDDDRERKSS